MTENPYQSPTGDTVMASGASRRWSIKGQLASLLFGLPIFLAFPIRYWVLNYAGNWFASTRLQPEVRAVSLWWGYLQVMFCVTVYWFLLAFLLLWIAGLYFMLTGVLTANLWVVARACAVAIRAAQKHRRSHPLSWIIVYSYIEFG